MVCDVHYRSHDIPGVLKIYSFVYNYILGSHSSINHLFSVYSQCFLYAFSWVGAVEFVVCFHNLDNHNEEIICNDSGK